MIPDKQQTIDILKKHVEKKPNLEHSLIVGYGMEALSNKLEPNKTEQEKWFVAGTLHDIDIEKYNGMENHCIKGKEILLEENIDEDIIETIMSHNECLGIPIDTNIKKSLYVMDALSGIIRAYVLMRPDKDISQLKTKSILKKIKDKTFTANVSREQIRLCETELNINLHDFVEIVVEGLKDKQIF
jgi:uncharacterized protein